MKKIYPALVILFFVICTDLPASEEASSDKGAETAVKQTMERVLSYFNPVSGKVSEVEGSKVKVEFPEGMDIRKGMRFSAFRQGKPFHHPVTDELIGYAEDFAGRIEATGEKADEGLYDCVIIRGDIRAGDAVRITASKVRIVFFQERKSDWELSETFYGSLKDSGRFELLESYTSSYRPEDLSQLARGLNAEAVLLFSTPVRDENMFLNVKLYWAEDAKIFAGIEETAGRGITDMTAPEEKFLSSSLIETEPWGSYRLDAGQLFGIGDVDGNGISELVVSNGSDISIFNFREELQETWVIKGTPGARHISLDILDLNNNGRAEIFVTALSGDTGIKTDDSKMGRMKAGDIAVRSFVLEFDPAEGYRKIRDNVPYFLRVAGKTLLMQKFGGARVFSNPVFEGEWKDGDYQTGRQLVLPPDVNIYGFTFVDWQDKGRNQIMAFDDEGHLTLYDSQGHALWRSGRTYGKFYLSFETEKDSIANPLSKWFVRGRLMNVRTGRGEEIIVVNRMSLIEKVPGLGTKGAEAYSLWWDGSGMEEKLILSGISGNTTDYRVEGGKLFLIAKGDLLSFFRNAVTGELSKGSVLYYYNLGEK